MKKEEKKKTYPDVVKGAKTKYGEALVKKIVPQKPKTPTQAPA